MRPDVAAFVEQQLCQAALATIIGLVTLGLFRQNRRPFLRLWGVGWALSAATHGLIALEALRGPSPGVLDPPLALALLTDLASFGSLVALALGVIDFDRGRRASPRTTVALLALAALLTVISAAGRPDDGFAWRYPIKSGIAALGCLAAIPVVWRRGRLLALAIGGYGLPMAGYAILTTMGDGAISARTLDRVVAVGYLDNLLMSAMAVAMIVWLLQQERRATALALDNEQSLREQLAAREARFRSILERVPEALALVDNEGRYLSSVRPDRGFIGIHGDALVGTSVLDLVHPEDRPKVMAVLSSLAHRPGATEVVEARVRHADGRWLTLECAGTNCEEVSFLQGILVTARDVTDQRARETRRGMAERLETVGRLAGGIAHDFNNLLTVVQGNANLLAERLAPSSPEREMAIEIDQAATRGAHLTQHLLAFARRRPVAPRAFDLRQLVSDLLPILRRLVGETVTVDWVPPATGCGVLADPHQMEQVVVNLCANAHDAMPSGGVLRIRVDRVDKWVRLLVTDTGVGMTDDTRRRAFEPFFTTKDISGGAGLGLATCYGIVEQAGGTIALESEPGRGTRAIVSLPAIEVWPEDPRPPAEPAAPEPASGLVLLVEDEPAVRSIAARALVRAGFSVVQAPDGLEAAEWLEADGAASCVVTDVVMPRLSGDRLARRIWSRTPGLPVLFTCGYSHEFHPELVSPAHRAAFLRKPYQPDELVRAVARLLGAPRATTAALPR
ncbi:MAG: ATP-binding protein [Gemmatimonadales bacterium]